MKAIWTGSLSFGLINIPIRVYPASEEHVLEFHMLHKKDLSPVRFARVCKDDGQEVAFSDIVKGYEYQKGEYVVVEDKDFKAANPKKTSSIEILQFTDLSSIEPLYYDKPYFLEPDKKAGKAYQLLNAALEHSQKVAIVNYVFRNKEHLGVILSSKQGLLLIQMRYHSELRSPDELDIPQEKISPAELKMALTLIEQSSQEFHAEKFHDTYTEDLLGIINAKLKGKKIKKKAEKTKKTPQTLDLMNLLKASLDKSSHEELTEKKKHYLPSYSKKSQAKRKHSR